MTGAHDILGVGLVLAEGLGDGVVLSVVGVLVVFGALALTWGVLAGLTRLLASRTQHPQMAAETAPQTQAEADRLDPRTVAVLAAAASAAAGGPIRLLRVRRVHRDPSSMWTGHSRTLIHSSHRFRTK